MARPLLDIPPDGYLVSRSWITGTGQVVVAIHEDIQCIGHKCVVHNPSDHSMRDFPTHWREDRGIVERICPHGIGHPDPDDMAHLRRQRGDEAAQVEGIHGCDGCCG